MRKFTSKAMTLVEAVMVFAVISIAGILIAPKIFESLERNKYNAELNRIYSDLKDLRDQATSLQVRRGVILGHYGLSKHRQAGNRIFTVGEVGVHKNNTIYFKNKVEHLIGEEFRMFNASPAFIGYFYDKDGRLFKIDANGHSFLVKNLHQSFYGYYLSGPAHKNIFQYKRILFSPTGVKIIRSLGEEHYITP